MKFLVSIIMPVFNGEKYIGQAIQSVLGQSYENWELLVINDGSSDRTRELVSQIRDPRLRFFEQENHGVSAARNVGLKHMTGDFFCFLDADDLLTPDSILLRLSKFIDDEAIDYVDGVVRFFSTDNRSIRTYTPQFIGPPLHELFLLNGSCFAGATWMIRRRADYQYAMKEHLSHGEDLFFYMELARHMGLYTSVPEEIYLYRQHNESAMRHAESLWRGYRQIYNALKSWPEFTLPYRLAFQWRIRRFMTLEYLHRKQFGRALSALVK